jgi:hypothetical protein
MIADALAAYAKQTARTFEGRENSVGASEVGQCARKIYFAKNAGDHIYGAASDEDYTDPWGAALRGTLVENHFWVPALRARYGDKLLYAGDQQQTFVSGFLSATPDGLLIDQPRNALAKIIDDIGGDGSIVVEAKTIDPRARLDGPRSEHAYQAQVQLGLIRELTSHQPQWAVISYINALFLDDVVEFPIHFDSAIFVNAKRRAAEIAVARSPDELKPEGWITGGRECEYCAFNQACGVVRHAVPTQPAVEAPDPQFVAEISDLAREAKARRALAEAATSDLREIEHTIKERLRVKGQRRINGGDVTVTWSAVRGRPAYDMPAIREAAAAAGIDLTQFEAVGDPTDRLTIRMTGHRNGAAAESQTKIED